MPKTVEMEIAEAGRMHVLAQAMRKAGDASSADLLESKVRTKRRKAIARMGKRVRRGKGAGKAVI